MAYDGGWSPVVLRARAGQPLHLLLTSDDVTHGFAVGRSEFQPVDVLPGKVTVVDLLLEEPGTYTFYCTRWCGSDHWRMRGTIEVTGGAAAPEADPAPLYVSLGLDLDAPHPAAVVPEARPSVLRGRELAAALPLAPYSQLDYIRSHSPAQAFLDLRADPALAPLSPSQTWDVIAHLWTSQVSAGELAEARALYAQNCAACHGERGAGDGIFADDLTGASASAMEWTNGAGGMALQQPADLTSPLSLLGASPALLQGKLMRGGMGTGMPMWGTILTDSQSWQIVAYLYTLQFEEVEE
jgi:mono/diheme cytochrome c family protein